MMRKVTAGSAGTVSAVGIVSAIGAVGVILLAVQLDGQQVGAWNSRNTAHAAAGRAAAALASKPDAATVQVDTPGYWSWAMLDRRTGRLTGSSNLAATNTTESMVKTWIVADYLREQAVRGKRPPADMLRLAATGATWSSGASSRPAG